MFYHSKPLHFRITSFKKGDQPTIYTKMNCRQVNWSDYQLQSIMQTDDVVSSVVSSVATTGSEVLALTTPGSKPDDEEDQVSALLISNGFDPLESQSDDKLVPVTTSTSSSNNTNNNRNSSSSSSSSSSSGINYSLSTTSEVIIQDLSASGFQLLKEHTPLYFGSVPNYVKKTLPKKYIDKMIKGLADCQDRILKEESFKYRTHISHPLLPHPNTPIISIFFFAICLRIHLMYEIICAVYQ
jgi:hypothetical protein